MAGDAIAAVGYVQEGRAARMAGEYNAQVAEQNAAYSLEQAKEDERRQRQLAKKFIGEQRASYGASGITMDGSALDVLQESAANAELDALTIRFTGRQRYSAYVNEANAERTSGKNQQKAAYLKAAAKLADGGDKAAKAAAGGGGG